MSDYWFDITGINNFWIRRRFAVLHRLTWKFIAEVQHIAEVGCGHGLLQRQIEDAYQKPVVGFDLNEYALKRNVSRHSKLYCYDISDRHPGMAKRFDLVFLFDVLEHVREEDDFLAAVKFHLTDGGMLLVNVPAGQWAYSTYDQAVGHVRRYSANTLRRVAERNDLIFDRWSYWGLPLIPTLLARKLWLAGRKDQKEIVSRGIDAGSGIANSMLGLLSACEVIPQRLVGTSLMAVVRKKYRGS